MDNTTIAAICSGMSVSGISVIRISGDDAFAVADKVFHSVSGTSVADMRSFSVAYGHIYEGEELLDEVLLIKMKAPRSYTREDVVEIDCHGGIVVTRRVLSAVLHAGAVPAEPGEFTKRAFLNGRIDLSQAEAVIDIINSENELALKNSLNQLKGDVREKIASLRDRILSKTAYIEAALDDPEHISLDGFGDTLMAEVTSVKKEIDVLVGSFENGRIIKEGINTVILGRPNAGKSSLLNVFSGTERAIVTDIAGTTRDTLEESVYLDGIVLNLIDTAGIRETDNIIERIGVEKAEEAAKNADLVLYVCDLTVGVSDDDKKILESVKDKKTIILLNKCDTDGSLNADGFISSLKSVSDAPCILVSAKDRTGIGEVKSAVTDMFYSGSLQYNDGIYITNVRQRDLLERASEALSKVLQSIELGMPEDFYTIDMMEAYSSLGLITGDNIEDDLADKIFSDFCMGK